MKRKSETPRQRKLRNKRKARRVKVIRRVLFDAFRMILVALVMMTTAGLILLIRNPIICDVDGVTLVIVYASGLFASLWLWEPDFESDFENEKSRH